MHFFRHVFVNSATTPGVALPPASLQSFVRRADVHECTNAVKTWMSKNGLDLTKKLHQ